MPARLILFDMGNVLLKFSHEKAARQMAAVAGCSYQLVWDTVFAGELEWDYECGRINGDGFYERFCHATRTRPVYADLEQAGCDIFELNEPILPLIGELQDRGYPLGVFSNTNEAHWRFVTAKYPFLTKNFQKFALSYELGNMKPQAEAYAKAAFHLGAAPAGIFFTDDRAENVAAAQEAGWHATQFTSAHALRDSMLRAGLLPPA
jgi:putative hydrolase of the HAD superfamily